MVSKISFHKHKHLIDIDKVDINRIVFSKKASFSKTTSLGAEVILVLCIKLPRMNGYAKYLDDSIKCMNFLIMMTNCHKSTMQ